MTPARPLDPLDADLPRPYEVWLRLSGAKEAEDHPIWVIAHTLREATIRAEAVLGAGYEIVSIREVAARIVLMQGTTATPCMLVPSGA